MFVPQIFLQDVAKTAPKKESLLLVKGNYTTLLTDFL